METYIEDSSPTWVLKLSTILAKNPSVGLLAFRNNSAKVDDYSVSVYIGCSQGGSSSSYSTSTAEVFSSMTSVGKRISTVPFDTEGFGNFHSILPSYITGKYYYSFEEVTLCICDNKVLAVCDMRSKEIFLPDVSNDIGWSGDTDRDVGQIASLVLQIVESMGRYYYDNLYTDIVKASDQNSHVKVTAITAETTFDKDAFVRSCLNSCTRYEESLDGNYRRVFDSLKNDVRVAQGKGIYDALELITQLKAMHFSFLNYGMLKYTGGRITADTGIYHDALYKTKSELWISGLKLVCDNGKIVDARCYRAYHPNCSGRHVCLGELAGIDIKDAQQVVEAMKVPNFSNGYWSGSQDYLGEKVIDLEGDTERVWSSDDE